MDTPATSSSLRSWPPLTADSSIRPGQGAAQSDKAAFGLDAFGREVSTASPVGDPTLPGSGALCVPGRHHHAHSDVRVPELLDRTRGDPRADRRPGRNGQLRIRTVESGDRHSVTAVTDSLGCFALPGHVSAVPADTLALVTE